MVEPCFEESIGFVARAMKNFGLSDLHLVNPAMGLGSSGRMRGGHAQDVLDSIVVHDSLSAALDGLDLSIGTTAQRGHSSASLLRKLMTPEELGTSLAGLSGQVGLVFGREGSGLNNHELSLCDAIVTIPTAEVYPTLNVSHAAAVIFYELNKSALPAAGDDLASADVRRTILEYLSESLARAGLEEYRIGLTVHAFKSVMGRSAIRRREASLLAGALRHISAIASRSRSSLRAASGGEQVKPLLEE
jgi:tRNA/rRNA methyltransferase